MANITLDQTPSKDSISENAIIAVADGDKLKHIRYSDFMAVIRGQVNSKVPISQKAQPGGVASLDQYGKVPTSQINQTGITYKGAWDAENNTPALSNSSGKMGEKYIISVSGTQDLGNGPIEFVSGGSVVYNGSIWEYIPQAEMLQDAETYVDIRVMSITPEMFGAKGDGITDDAPAIQAALDYAYSLLSDIGTQVEKLLTTTPTVILGPKRYKVNQQLTIKRGVTIVAQQATLLAGAPVFAVLKTPDSASVYSSAYANARINIVGSLIIDGADMAGYGFWGNTLAECLFDSVTATRCTVPRWGNEEMPIASYDAGSGDITVSGPVEKITLRDVVRVYNATTGLYEPGIYSIHKITDGLLDLSPGLVRAIDTGVNTYYLHSIPVGFYANGNQNIFRNISAKNNTLGIGFGITRKDLDTGFPLGLDDNYYDRLFADVNDIACGLMAISTSTFVHCTAQHSTYENLIIANCGNLRGEFYSEIASNFWGVQPGNGREDYPLNYISGNGIDLMVHSPVNPSVGWARNFHVNGENVQLHLSCHSNRANALENPDVPGDFAVVKLVSGTRTPNPFVRLSLSMYNNLQTNGNLTKAVINESGVFPENNCLVEAVNWQLGRPMTAGRRYLYQRSTYYTGLEANQRIEIDPDNTRIGFGPGTTAPDAFLQRFAPGVVGTGGQFQINGVVNNRKPDGSGFYTYSTNDNKFKWHTSVPSDRDTQGTAFASIISAQQNVTFGEVAANAELVGGSTVTVNGSAIGDQVVVQPSSNISGINYKAFVTSANTVTVFAMNYTTSPITPGSVNLKISILK